MGDGSSTSITITVATAALVMQFPLVRSSDEASTKFDLTSLTVTNAVNLISSDGQTISATVGLLGATITFDWPIAVPNGTRVTVYGDLVF